MRRDRRSGNREVTLRPRVEELTDRERERLTPVVAACSDDALYLIATVQRVEPLQSARLQHCVQNLQALVKELERIDARLRRSQHRRIVSQDAT